MTYLQFLLIFLVPPICLLGWFFLQENHADRGIFGRGILLLCSLAFVWTTPWDNYLVARGIWSYGAERVMGTIGFVPIEEYMFFFLQTVLTGLWCFWLHSRRPIVTEELQGAWPKAIVLALGALLIVGVVSLFSQSSLYLGLILSWALPVCLLHWLVGGGFLSKNWGFFLKAALPPTVYLWFADALAIHLEIWSIADETIVGLKFGNLPLEEALFFFLTNVMVVQGLILFIAMKDWVRQRFQGRGLFLYKSDEQVSL